MNGPFTVCIQWVALQQNLTLGSPKNLPTSHAVPSVPACSALRTVDPFDVEVI